MDEGFDDAPSGPLKSGERLFVETGDHREIAMVDYSLTESRYILSYREAGEVLTAGVMNGEIADLLVFPVLSAYRHWLELRLKSLITLGQRWRREPVELIKTHKLDVLWPKAREAIEAAFPDDPADLDTIGSIVDELAGVDPASMSFRYSSDPRGRINLSAGLERINLRHVADVMSQVGLLLDGAADGMDDMLVDAEDYGP